MYLKPLLYSKNLMLAALISGVTACGSSAPQVSSTVKAGQETLINLQDIVFYAPADNLPEGMEVGLTAEPVNDVDEDILEPEDKALSEVLTVSFGEHPASQALYTVQFQLEPAVYSNIAVLTRTVGGLTTEGVTDTGWVPGFGHYDEKTSVYSVTKAATAKQVSLLVYTRRLDGSESGLLQHFPEAVRKGLEIAGSISAISSVSAQVLAPQSSIDKYTKKGLTSHGWAIRCDPKKFKRDKLCSAGSTKLKKLLQLAVQSAENLKKLGFSHVFLRTETLSSLRLTPDVVEFSDAADSLASEQVYFTMILVPRIKGDKNTIGQYEPGDVAIYVTPKADSATIIHEILHAVQVSEIIFFWDQLWVIEGTAAAVEPFAPEYQGNRGKAFRYEGDWRDWSVELNNSDQKRFWYYEVSEYWLSIDPGLSYLPLLYDTIGANRSEVSKSGSIDMIDEALQAKAGINLDDSFTDLIETRDGEIEKGYKWCEEIKFTCKDKKCPISKQSSFDFKPMSATCFKVKAKFAELGCRSPVYKLDFEGDEKKHRFVVDGQRFEANETATVKEEFNFWVINLARDREDDAKPEATLKALCSPVSIVSQEHSVSARVSSCEPRIIGHNQTCQKKDRGIDYSSDLIEGTSRITTWESDQTYGLPDREVKDGQSPILAGHSFERSFDISVDGGTRAVAHLFTLTRDEDEEFIVEGQFKLQATHPDMAGWGGRAGAEVDFSIELVVGVPAMMYITNCELFEVSGTFKPIKTSGSDCEYKSSLDTKMMKINNNQDYGLLSSVMSAEDMAKLKSYPRGETVMLFFRRQEAFSSKGSVRESDRADSEQQFKIRIVYD